MEPADSNSSLASARGFARWLVETTVMVGVAFAIAMVFRATVAQAYEIPTPSMEPTIMVHDRVLTERVSHYFRDPKVGDVVVIDNPSGGAIPYVKRVIALAGQTVDVRDGSVWVDDERLTEPYTHGLPSERLSLDLPLTVPNGYVWLMGDNRTNSSDSRDFGPVPTDSIQARALCVYWPPEHAGGLAQ